MIACTRCQDSGKLPGSDYLDCGCQAAIDRHQLNIFVEKLRAERVPEYDVPWFVHRRALAMVKEGA